MVDTSPGGDARIFSEPSPGHVVAGYRLDARKPLQLSRRPVPLHGRWEGGARGHALLGGRRCQRCRRNYLANNTNKPDLSTRQTLATNSRNRTIERRPSRRICRSKGVPSLERTSRNDEASRRLTGLLVGAGSLGSVDAGLLTLRALVSPRRDRLLAQLRPPGRHAARPLQLLLPRHLGDEGRRQRVYGIGAAPAPHARGRGPRIRERLPLLPKRHQRA